MSLDDLRIISVDDIPGSRFKLEETWKPILRKIPVGMALEFPVDTWRIESVRYIVKKLAVQEEFSNYILRKRGDHFYVINPECDQNE